MVSSFPTTTVELLNSSWADFAPFAEGLESRALTEQGVGEVLAGWSRLSRAMAELQQRLYVATTVDTADAEAERRYHAFLDDSLPPYLALEQRLKEKLLASGLSPESFPQGFEVPLRDMRAEAALFREVNIPLLTQSQKLGAEYDKIAGAQTVEWEGREVTLPGLAPVFQNPERGMRERAWRLAAERQLADRGALNTLWQKLLRLRREIAGNAGFEDFRGYAWQDLKRFDYGPEDCLRFHEAIEEVAVPAATRLYEKRRERLGLKSLRPWDLAVDPLRRAPLRPFGTVAELTQRTAAIFDRVDPELGAHFETMIDEGLLDLDNRKNKAPGGYCTDFAMVHRPFIFMNAVGLHEDVQTLLHEGGHAFHTFATAALPYYQQLHYGAEIAEVASMAMELLAAPYLAESEGGFYSREDAARARVEHLELNILFWPYMAVVDAFQHWAYTHPDEAMEPERCDATWRALQRRFVPGIDWSGLEDEEATGWQRKLHIFQLPFYYVEYGLAQLGAAQVWRNALTDQARAVRDYRRALSLGATRPLPELYAAAGARLAFDAGTLGEAVGLMERTIGELEG